MGKQKYVTVGEIAHRFGCEAWQVRRLYERGVLRESARAGQYRLIRVGDLPKVEAALRAAGYLRERETVASA
jgi:hypothetical protein